MGDHVTFSVRRGPLEAVDLEAQRKGVRGLASPHPILGAMVSFLLTWPCRCGRARRRLPLAVFFLWPLVPGSCLFGVGLPEEYIYGVFL